MEIIYPPLVEQGFKFHLKEAKEVLDKSTFYRSMVSKGIITETGMPTLAAIQQGLVKDYFEDEDLTFAEFLALYPIFATYDPALFQQIAGFWEIPVTMKEDLIRQLASGKLTYDEIQQIESFLEDR